MQNLFRLAFVKAKANVVFLGGVGVGQTHLATALGHAAVMVGHTVRFAGAVDFVNTLTTDQREHRLKAELKKNVQPDIMAVDELGNLPIDKNGADLLFQVISRGYEQGSVILTTNQPYKT